VANTEYIRRFLFYKMESRYSNLSTLENHNITNAEDTRDPQALCMALHHNYDNMLERDYFLWDAVMCDVKRPFICQQHTKDIGCVDGCNVYI
jgi:hypothetical protein